MLPSLLALTLTAIGPTHPVAAKWGEPIKDHGKFTGAYGGLRLQPGSMNQSAVLMWGGGGGVHFSHRFFIGGAGYASVQYFSFLEDRGGKDYGIHAAYGGGEVGWSFFKSGKIDLHVKTLLGGGQACLYEEGREGTCVDRTNLFVAQPETGMFVRLGPVFRLGATVGYRFTVADEWRVKPRNWAMAGFVGTLSMEWGWF
jgi:hypothetical protein